MACATFLLLTLTVLQREDRDGYQATHLFFMPRSTWEMDQGRGMLYDEEHYRQVDLDAYVAEETGSDLGSIQEIAGLNRGADSAQQADEPDATKELAAPDGADRLSQPTHVYSPALRKMPYAPGTAGTDVPVLITVPAFTASDWQPYAVCDLREQPGALPGDVPSPPPRNTS